LIGAAAALLAMEVRRVGGSWRTAVKTGRTLLAAYLVALVLEVTLSIGMVAVFSYGVLSR
jgi:hypothetical protein